MAGLPQLGAVLGLGGPGESATAAFPGYFAEMPRLLGHLDLAAMEFQQQQRRLRQGQLGIGIAGADLLGVEQFDPRQRNAGLDAEDRGLAAAAHGLERTGGGGYRLGDAAQLDGEFG